MFCSLEICHLLKCVNHRLNCIDQGQWPLNTTADVGDFPNDSQWLTDLLNDVVGLVEQWNI